MRRDGAAAEVRRLGLPVDTRVVRHACLGSADEVCDRDEIALADEVTAIQRDQEMARNR